MPKTFEARKYCEFRPKVSQNPVSVGRFGSKSGNGDNQNKYRLTSFTCVIAVKGTLSPELDSTQVLNP